jgi:hypothetical protein
MLNKNGVFSLILLAIGLTACAPTETTIPPVQDDLTPTPTPILLAHTATPLPTEKPGIMPTMQPSATLQPTHTTLVETQIPGVVLKLTVTECLTTFCPPYWLDQESKTLLGQPGILASMALDEKDILITYDPETLTEEEAIELFVRMTNLEVEQ